MFKVNGQPIITSEMDVLLELRTQLQLNGVYLFHTLRPGPRNIQFNCPIHNNGQERKPSCGVAIVDAVKGGQKVEAGTVHCFTCGYTAPLEKMISHCFGHDDEGAFGIQWLVKNFVTVSVEDRKPIQLDMSRGGNRAVESYISEDELDTYRYFHPYMYERKLTDAIIEWFDVGYDSHFVLKDKNGRNRPPIKCITFPVRDVNGNTLFIARRAIKTKFFHYPLDVKKPVYGLDILKNVDCNELIICESIINALTCWVYGKPAVALLGLGTEYQYAVLEKLPQRVFITALDPDDAGRKATQRLRERMGKRKVVYEYAIPTGKDINDLTEEEFASLEKYL